MKTNLIYEEVKKFFLYSFFFSSILSTTNFKIFNVLIIAFMIDSFYNTFIAIKFGNDASISVAESTAREDEIKYNRFSYSSIAGAFFQILIVIFLLIYRQSFWLQQFK